MKIRFLQLLEKITYSIGDLVYINITSLKKSNKDVKYISLISKILKNGYNNTVFVKKVCDDDTVVICNDSNVEITVPITALIKPKTDN
jgi:hypothetical protein